MGFPLLANSSQWKAVVLETSRSIAACFKMVEKEAESEAGTVETGWSVSTSWVLIQFYSENPLLWDKNHKEYGKKNIITKTEALLLKLGKASAVRLLSSDPTIWSPSEALLGGVFMSPVWISNLFTSQFRKVSMSLSEFRPLSHWYRCRKCLTIECLTEMRSRNSVPEHFI